MTTDTRIRELTKVHNYKGWDIRVVVSASSPDGGAYLTVESLRRRHEDALSYWGDAFKAYVAPSSDDQWMVDPPLNAVTGPYEHYSITAAVDVASDVAIRQQKHEIDELVERVERKLASDRVKAMQHDVVRAFIKRVDEINGEGVA